ncbi:hypothetical protein ACFLVE_04710, partial [Chloroflexota bacterium]
YEACVEKVNEWVADLDLGQNAIQDGYHLDGGTIPTVVISINKDMPIDEEKVSRLNYILKDGFKKLMR